MHLSQRNLCTRKTDLSLEMKFYLDFHRVARPWRRTLTNRSDVKYVFPLANGSGVKYVFPLANGSDVKYVFPQCCWQLILFNFLLLSLSLPPSAALDSTKLALLIAVGILGVLVVVLLLMIAGHFLRRRRKRNSTNQESVINNDNHSRKKFVLPLPKKQNGTDKKDPDNQKARFSIRSPEEPPPRPPKNYGKAEQSVKNSGKVPKATRAQSVPDARTVATLPRSRAQDDSFAAENESK